MTAYKCKQNHITLKDFQTSWVICRDCLLAEEEEYRAFPYQAPKLPEPEPAPKVQTEMFVTQGLPIFEKEET